jgi:hypothetical protein
MVASGQKTPHRVDLIALGIGLVNRTDRGRAIVCKACCRTSPMPAVAEALLDIVIRRSQD